ncbi:MAG: TlpA disulfide reductase family protein [Gammaproteobacteria bacterium]|nr:TlpA disulfide reductase family protein [Gammaproteobacteria bacterium]
MTGQIDIKRFFLLIILWGCLLPGLVSAETAPRFSLRDSSGDEVSLSDFQGQPLVLHFWATWCPYCKKLQPGLQRLGRDYKEAGLVVLGISFSEDDGAQPQAVLRQRGLSFTTLIEGDSVASLYAVRGTPTTFFIDREGNIVAVTNTSDPDDPVLEKQARAISR